MQRPQEQSNWWSRTCLCFGRDSWVSDVGHTCFYMHIQYAWPWTACVGLHAPPTIPPSSAHSMGKWHLVINSTFLLNSKFILLKGKSTKLSCYRQEKPFIDFWSRCSKVHALACILSFKLTHLQSTSHLFLTPTFFHCGNISCKYFLLIGRKKILIRSHVVCLQEPVLSAHFYSCKLSVSVHTLVSP